jgi:hypothetical protein
MDTVNLFSTLLFQKLCALDIKNIEKLCYEHRLHNESDFKSNVGGYQGKNFQCDVLKEEIINSFPRVENKPIKDLEVDMWVNINNTNSHNAIHSHAPFNGVVLSGVFYVKCPENCGNINFYDPRFFVTSALDMQYYNDANTYFFFEPKENLMLIFPSWLHHSVSANQNEQDRISIAFNISWKL